MDDRRPDILPGTSGIRDVPFSFPRPIGRPPGRLRAAVPRWALIALLASAALPSGGTLRAQWLGDSASEALTHAGIDHIYNLKFDSARAEFRRVIAAHPDHPAGHFFLAAVEWWRIMADIENTSYDDTFITMLDGVIGLCDRRLDRDEHDLAALFFKGGALGFQGRLYGNREDWIKAANCGRSALPIVRETYRLAPENEDVLFGIGIYNYYAAIIPEMYPFVKPLMLFFPEGDRAKGLEQLRRASGRAKYAGTEASYFLLQILYNFEKQYAEAGLIASELHRKYPDNPLFHRYAGRTAAALGQWENASGVFGEILAKVRSGTLGYGPVVERECRYYLGLIGMQNNDLDSALANFYRCDELSRTTDGEKWTGFMTLANLKIGMIYDLQGKRDLALTQYRKVLDMKDYQSAHDQAREYTNRPYARP
jgi:tetratricopeptide (TPR) repeat protein